MFAGKLIMLIPGGESAHFTDIARSQGALGSDKEPGISETYLRFPFAFASS